MNSRAIESDVVLARSGDEAAFGRLVGACANTVCSIALAIVRDVHASEDVAQETFIAAWRDLHNLHNPSSFLPWVRQVTRNQAHLWRREHHREISDEAVLEAARDDRRSAEDDLVAAEEQRLLREVLDQLPDEAREVLVLYYREERSTEQVSILLGISEAAVRQRVSRARALLRAEMLERFGRTVARTAPAAAFGAAVAGALTLSAPTASAAIAGSAATAAAIGGKAAVGVATLAGGLLGWAGVLMGMKWLEPFFDEEEERELLRFRNTLLVIVTVGCAAAALCRFSTLAMLIAVQTVYAVIIYMYAVRLPRILERRMAWERSVNPEMAKQSRRQWMWATISRAVGAALGGAMVMATLLRGFP